jgi:hypothetical protein
MNRRGTEISAMNNKTPDDDASSDANRPGCTQPRPESTGAAYGLRNRLSLKKILFTSVEHPDPGTVAIKNTERKNGISPDSIRAARERHQALLTQMNRLDDVLQTISFRISGSSTTNWF